MKIRTIQTEKAPTPAGHYSQAVVYNGLVFVAGQVAIDPNTGERKVGSIEEQTEQVLKNVSEVLKAAGSGLQFVLKMTVFVTDIGLWERVNKVYSRVLGDHRPARAIIPIRELKHGYLIEIDAIAATEE
jgi:2-iminobutanoate/2-iminopropanoate deaminase